MNCKNCIYKRDDTKFSVQEAVKYHFGIKFWLFEYVSLEVVEDGTKPVCYALPEPVEIEGRENEKCAYYKEGMK